jgi:tetratricopeptide (TPR) repeat protein
MKIFFTLLVTLSFCYSNLLSQQFSDEQIEDFINNAPEEELVEINTILNLEGSYNQARKVALKLLEYQPESSNYNFRAGYALINSSIDFNESKSYLEKAVENISKNYDMISKKEKGAPIDALYYMGKSYHFNNELDKAKLYYEKFVEAAPRKDEKIEDAKLKMIQCDVAKKLLENSDKSFTVVNLGSTINSSYPDYSPVVSLDGYSLYYTSRRLRKDKSNEDIKEPGTPLYLEDVYVSRKNDEGQWSEPKIMNFCKPDKNEATVAVSTDERRIYVYKDETGNGDIYFSDFEASKFQELQKLKTDGVNTDAWEPHITVTPDGQQRYFSSDREGGYGGRDLYRIIKLPNGKWSEPQNLGPNINTPYDEDAPFLAVDNKTMYFATNGPKSMGGFDIFKTVRDENNLWSTPENLGHPLNTTSDDIYYTTTVDGFTGYLTSFRANGVGEKDIYEIKNTHLGINNVAVLRGEIETTTGEPIPEDVAFTLRCMDCEDAFDIEFFPRISDGSFISSLVPCHSYRLILHHENGETKIHEEFFNTTCSADYEEVYRHIMLDVPTMSVIAPKELISSFPPISMKHYFGYNKNKLDPNEGALKLFLDSLKNQIEMGRTDIVLKINSSASKVRTRTFQNNQKLAQTRAEKLKTLLEIYFTQTGLSDSVDMTINKVEVAGPEYDKDFRNIDKYIPFQYVSLSLEGENSVSEEMISLESQDENVRDFAASGRTINEGKVSTDRSGDTFTSGKMNEGDYNFYVVTGVFRKLSNAEGMVKSAKKKGFDAKIVGKKNGLNVVSVGSSNSFSEIKSILSRAREEVTESAWILN